MVAPVARGSNLFPAVRRARADLYTEVPVKVSGFKQSIGDAEWTITSLTHNVSVDSGSMTNLELEVRIDDLEME